MRIGCDSCFYCAHATANQKYQKQLTNANICIVTYMFKTVKQSVANGQRMCATEAELKYFA